MRQQQGTVTVGQRGTWHRLSVSPSVTQVTMFTSTLMIKAFFLKVSSLSKTQAKRKSIPSGDIFKLQESDHAFMLLIDSFANKKRGGES